MFFIIISVISILLMIVAKSSRLNVASKRMIMLFIAYWGVSMILSSIGIPSLNKPQNFTFVLLLLNVVMFTLGFLILKPVAKEFISDDINIHQFVSKIVDSKCFILLIVSSTILCLALFYIMRTVLAVMGDLGEVRTMFFEGSLYGATIGWIIKLLLNPMHYVCIPLLGYMLFYRRDWKCLVIATFLLAFVSLDGGRFGYLRIAVGILFVNFCILCRKKIKLKNKMILAVAMFGFLYLMAIVSHARSDSGKSIFADASHHFALYLCGPSTALDYAIENDYIGQMGGYTWGRLTFSSVDDIVYLFGRVLGYRFYIPITDFTEIKQDTPISVGDTDWNALYTAVLFFWIDGGVLGCVLFPFILGIGFRYLVRIFYRYRTWQLFVLLAMFFQLNMHSVCDLSFSDPFLLIFVVFLYIKGKRQQFLIAE